MQTVPRLGAGGAIPRPLFHAPQRRRVAVGLGVAVGFVLGMGATRAGGDPLPAVAGKIGHASWYGRDFARRRTASGERFDPQKLTCAHRTLPLGSRVRVTNLTNGRSVLVTITDRGPFLRRRDIDLSWAAAREIGMVQRGVARVRIEPLES